MVTSRAVVAAGSGTGVTVLSESEAPHQFPLRFRILYHVVDLFETAPASGAGGIPVTELLFAMTHDLDAPVPQGADMDEFVRRISPEDKQEVQAAIDRLEQERKVAVERANEDDLWRVTPTDSGRRLIREWTRIRLDYLQHQVEYLTARLGAESHGWRQWRHGLVDPQPVALLLATVLGAVATVIVTHFLH